MVWLRLLERFLDGLAGLGWLWVMEVDTGGPPPGRILSFDDPRQVYVEAASNLAQCIYITLQPDKSANFKMPRESEPSLNEKTFVTQALAEGLRLDNRKFDQYRSLQLTFGDEYGVAEVQFGKTRYVRRGNIFTVLVRD